METDIEFADLCDEILLHVFHKLPHKLVVRCKLVCRKWCSLISDPFFTSTYNPVTIPNHPTSFIMIPPWSYSSHEPFTSMYEIDMRSSRYYRQGVGHKRRWTNISEENCSCITVLGSWNGLIALYYNGREFLLLNPWTTEEKRVRVVCNDFDFGYFDLSGLCHDSARDDYKAVLSKCSRSTCFYVVSLKDGKCKSKTQPNVLRDLHRHGYGFVSTIVKGVPHWIHEYDCKRPCSRDDCAIIYFDQQIEEFGEVRSPKDHAVLVGLGALDGQLTVAVQGQLVGALEVWALKEENSWTKLFVMVNYFASTTISLSSWTEDDKVLINRQHDTYLSVYNFRDRSSRELIWLINRQNCFRRYATFRGPHKIVTFVPSLVCPN